MEGCCTSFAGYRVSLSTDRALRLLTRLSPLQENHPPKAATRVKYPSLGPVSHCVGLFTQEVIKGVLAGYSVSQNSGAKSL